MKQNEITLEKIIRLKKEIMVAREQSELCRRNGFFDLNLKIYLKEKEQEFTVICSKINSKNAWRPL